MAFIRLNLIIIANIKKSKNNKNAQIALIFVQELKMVFVVKPAALIY